MNKIRIDDLTDTPMVPVAEAALVKGGPLQIKELVVKVDVRDPQK